MQSGTMRHLVRIQKPALNPDGQGGYSKDWIDVDRVKAQVAPGGGAEAYKAGQLEYDNLFRVTMRFRADINPPLGVTPSYRLVWEDAGNERILDINTAVNADGYKRWLILTCTERLPGPGPIT